MSLSFEENMTLEMTNVFSYRGIVSQQQMVMIAKEMEEIVRNSGAKTTGDSVSATFSVQKKETEILMDIEMMIPLDRTIDVPEPYIIKPIFKLTDAVKMHFVGNARIAQANSLKMNEYIASKNMTPITVGYSITKPVSNIIDPENMDFQIYVGVSRNIL